MTMESVAKPGTKPWPGDPGTKKGGIVPTTTPVSIRPSQSPQQADGRDASPQQAR